MKGLILAAAGVGAVIGVGLQVNRPTTKEMAGPKTVAGAEERAEVRRQELEARDQRPDVAESLSRRPAEANGPSADTFAPVVSDVGQVLRQDIETLASPQASFEQKQAVWERLRETGTLDQAIGELEQRLANDPQVPEYSAALGKAYLKKCALTQDVREQAIFAMKADQTLEAALSLDPSNWEARFTKAVGMSYWPAQLNKGQEVIQQFQALIELQEARAPQPEFAKSYVWLGDQYYKAGYSDAAAQVWQRGAALFPIDTELKAKLASRP
jgi:tetratricopeptide (TPR) repeat protein